MTLCVLYVFITDRTHIASRAFLLEQIMRLQHTSLDHSQTI
jgi:hypothetical protein